MLRLEYAELSMMSWLGSYRALNMAKVKDNQPGLYNHRDLGWEYALRGRRWFTRMGLIAALMGGRWIEGRGYGVRASGKMGERQ